MGKPWYRVYYVLGREHILVHTVCMSYNDAYTVRDDQSERNRTAWIEEVLWPAL